MSVRTSVPNTRNSFLCTAVLSVSLLCRSTTCEQNEKPMQVRFRNLRLKEQ